MKDVSPSFATWFDSLTDIERERALMRLREIAQAILAKHARDVLTQTTPQENVIVLN